MGEKKDYDPYMNDYEREVFEALGQEFKYSPREIKLIEDFKKIVEDNSEINDYGDYLADSNKILEWIEKRLEK